MSVLVEALTLIVPKAVLDISYPGGTDVYLKALLELERPPRFICSAEPQLTNVSFYDVDHLLPAVQLLQEHSIIVSDDGSYVEAAIMEQGIGPRLECSWLDWREHSDGFTYAWQSGSEPGDMAAPEGWTPQQSRELRRFDLRDEKGRGFRLSADASGEIWLDLKTGHVIEGLPLRAVETRSRNEEQASSSRNELLLPTVIAAMEEGGFEFTRIMDDVVAATASAEQARYRVIVSANEDSRVVICTCHLPVTIPDQRRTIVARMLNHLNCRIGVGSLQIDMDDGGLSSRTAIDVEGGLLTARMVENLVGSAIAACEFHFEDIMRAVYGADSDDAV